MKLNHDLINNMKLQNFTVVIINKDLIFLKLFVQVLNIKFYTDNNLPANKKKLKLSYVGQFLTAG